MSGVMQMLVGGKGGPSSLWSTMTLNWVAGSSGRAYPGTQGDYAAISTIPTTANYVFSSGYHYFDISAGSYSVTIKGAEGSSTAHGYGATIIATMVVASATRLVALVGNPASGNYSAGGMSAIALRNAASDIYTSAVPVVVAGGGGGGYANADAQRDGGDISWPSTTRRGTSIQQNYDGGAAFNNVYTPEVYPNTTGGQGSNAAQHWVWGGRGGVTTPCGATQGGFGGGGGSCPAGGGGYYGGKPGGDNPSGTSGGGGTSYRATSGTCYISTWADGSLNGSTRNASPGTAGGQIIITAL